MVANVDVVLVLGAFAGMLLAFYKVLDKVLGQGSIDREADRKERLELTTAIKRMANSSQDVAVATKKSAQEAKTRNGHLGEQNIQIANLVSAQNRDVTSIKDSNKKIADVLSKSALIAAEDRDVLLTPHEQHVEHQIVEHQEIKASAKQCYYKHINKEQ